MVKSPHVPEGRRSLSKLSTFESETCAVVPTSPFDAGPGSTHGAGMFVRLLALFILVPLAELAIFLWLGSRIGLPLTLAIIILTAFLGAALTRSQGTRALRAFREATAAGRLPHAEIVEGLIILVAGALLLTPGFLTDTIGFLALVPAIRHRVRKRLTASLAGRLRVVSLTPSTGDEPAPPRSAKGRVIDV